MGTVDHARKRVAAFIDEIYRLKQSEFPYSHTKEALDLLAKRFEHHLNSLDKASKESTTEDSLITLCSATLQDLFRYSPILGFILRSTNVRNAFEAYGPLLKLARSILGNRTKLIISSEWDFSPFTYQAITGLQDYVLIGLPASESSNPLLVPLAGHELGHSVWKTESISSEFETKIEDYVLEELRGTRWREYKALFPANEDKKSLTKIFVKPTWLPAYEWALLQTEETFCDLFGLLLFAESYLYAFAYLLAPGTFGQRSVQYPKIEQRIHRLAKAAKKMGVLVPPDFESACVPEIDPTEFTTNLLVSIADTVSDKIISDLIELVQSFAGTKNIPARDTAKVSSICHDFRFKIAPITEQHSLTNISNAGWECALDPDLWSSIPQIKPNDRDRVLKDLILKSMEVSEVYKRLEKNQNAS